MSSSHPSFTRAITAAVLLATALALVPHDASARDRQSDRRRGDGIARGSDRQARVQRSERGRVARAVRTTLDRRERAYSDRQQAHRYEGRRGDRVTRYRGGRHDGSDRDRSYRYEGRRGDHGTRYRGVYDDYRVRHYRRARAHYPVRYYRPAYHYSSGPAFGLLFAITNFPPTGYYYFDPYCDETFASLEIYLAHSRHHHHAHVIQLVALDGGYHSSYCWADGAWGPY